MYTNFKFCRNFESKYFQDAEIDLIDFRSNLPPTSLSLSLEMIFGMLSTELEGVDGSKFDHIFKSVFFFFV